MKAVVGLLVLLVMSPCLATDVQLIYTEQVNEGDSIFYLDPILSPELQLTGMIYLKKISQYGGKAIVDRWWRNVPDTFEIFRRTNSVNWIKSPDSLFVGLPSDELVHYAILTDDSMSDDWITPSVYIDSFAKVCGKSVSFDLIRDENRQPMAVELSWIADCHSLPPIETNSLDPTTHLYSLDFQTELLNRGVSNVALGDFRGDTAIDTCAYGNNFYEQCFWGTDADPLCFGGRYSALSFNSSDGNPWTYIFGGEDSKASLLSVVDAVPGNGHMELIFGGQFKPLDDSLAVPTEYIGCYDISGVWPVEVWRNNLSAQEFNYVYRSGGLLAGFAAPNRVEFINLRNGLVNHSIQLDRFLSTTTFFETGSNPSILHVAGRVADTIFIYKFDAVTDVEADHSGTLPVTFTVSNPYPNPFNPSTSIELALPENGRVSVSVLNLLGQQVAVVADKELTAGNFTFTWDGKDSRGRTVSSGVYFFAIKNAGNMVTRKMMLLK